MSMTWHRVFYRTGKQEVVFGEARLRQLLNRKVPAVMHHEVAIIHQCQQCDRQGPWMPEWIAYPIWNRIAPYHVEGCDQALFCSTKCWVAKTGGFDFPSWMDMHQEPRDIERQRTLFEAQMAEGDRRRQVTAHRLVPMPEWRGNGYCKWCGEAVNEGRRRSWHLDCVTQYFLHSDLGKQMAFIQRRDGQGCAIEGCRARGIELDHRVPLWSVRNLPDAERRPFYGPTNLQLLCRDHHVEKTSREAGERASRRSAA